MVSFRGLWDKFDGPGTPGSLRRAYRRGVPCLARIGADALSLEAVWAAWADASINRRRVPLYLVTTALPDLTAAGLAPVPAADAGVYAVLETGTRHPRRLYLSGNDAWQPAGWYLPVDGMPADLQPEMIHGGLVLFESANVVTDLARHSSMGIDYDDSVFGAIRAGTDPGTTVIRVSDMVELDQLDARRREAA